MLKCVETAEMALAEEHLKVSEMRRRNGENKLLYDSLKAEVAGLPNLFNLVKFQKAWGGAEYICMELPLINCLSVHQDLFAAGARRRQIHVGESGRVGECVSLQGKD